MKHNVIKAQMAADVFTTEPEVASRSRQLGLGGNYHVIQIDGQAMYMPGSSREEYLAYYGEYTEEDTEDFRLTCLREVVREIMKNDVNIEGQILKTDEDQRIVYGWASVITEKGEPVVDRQGDIIEASTLVKAVNEFMEYLRVGKEMHKGDEVGRVIHSLPVTKEIFDSLGIQTDREGWIVAMKVYDDATWDRVKSGELAAFSIGGRANREEITNV